MGPARGIPKPFRILSVFGAPWDRPWSGTRRAEVRRVCAGTPEGARALDPATWLGEVDHAARQEDCLDLASFVFRRTDLGLVAPDVAAAEAEALAARLGELLGWDADRRAAEVSAVRAELAHRAAWRDDPA